MDGNRMLLLQVGADDFNQECSPFSGNDFPGRGAPHFFPSANSNKLFPL
jgi:hypothetical protein